MHVAEIMNERTQEEKENFGRVNMALAGEQESNYGAAYTPIIGAQLTDINIDSIINEFIAQGEQHELIKESVSRSKDKFSCEFAKLQASYDNNYFFSDDGVVARK